MWSQRMTVIKHKYAALNVSDGNKKLSQLIGSTDAFSVIRVQSNSAGAAIKIGDITLDTNNYGIKLTAGTANVVVEFAIKDNKQSVDFAENLYFLADADNCMFSIFAY